MIADSLTEYIRKVPALVCENWWESSRLRIFLASVGEVQSERPSTTSGLATLLSTFGSWGVWQGSKRDLNS